MMIGRVQVHIADFFVYDSFIPLGMLCGRGASISSGFCCGSCSNV